MPPPGFAKREELKRKFEGATVTPTSVGTASDESNSLLVCELREVKVKLRKVSNQLRATEEAALRHFKTLEDYGKLKHKDYQTILQILRSQNGFSEFSLPETAEYIIPPWVKSLREKFDQEEAALLSGKSRQATVLLGDSVDE